MNENESSNIQNLPDFKYEAQEKKPLKIPLGAVVDLLVKIGALGLLFYWCYNILEPFITIALWSVILAVSLFPVYSRLKNGFGKRDKLAAGLITGILMLILIAPPVWMLVASGSELKTFADHLKGGTLTLPLPGEELKTFPVIGPYIFEFWSGAVNNLQGFAIEYQDQLKIILISLFGMIASTGKGLLILAISVIVSGVLLAYSNSGGNFISSFFKRVAGSPGLEMLNVATVTIRNVTRGILGVAFIQAMLAGIGIYMAGVPLAGLWTMICFMLSVMQLGMLPVSAGVIIYIWTVAPTTTAILLTVWMVLVGMVDNVLKPLLLGKGAPVPMLVVFLGAIGGFFHSGFIGLFTGAIVLSLGYNLFVDWVKQHETSD
ncbi:MAG: AI-2E family transporter [Chitinophagaceae bacterium]|nr:AI-2E family transporter [Chitinophagaceae bacterium]